MVWNTNDSFPQNQPAYNFVDGSGINKYRSVLLLAREELETCERSGVLKRADELRCEIIPKMEINLKEYEENLEEWKHKFKEKCFREDGDTPQYEDSEWDEVYEYFLNNPYTL